MRVETVGLIVTLTLGILSSPLAADAQQPAKKIPRIEFLGDSTAALEANLVGPFREGLRDLGYDEGRNVLQSRWLLATQNRHSGHRLFGNFVREG